MPQTTYLYSPPIAFAGMLADSGNSDRVTVANGEASAEIPFGVFVAKGAADNKCLLPASSADVLLGVVVHSHEYAITVELGTTGLKPKIPMAVMRAGRIWVLVEEAVNKGDQAFFRYASGSGGTQKGAVRKSADTSTAAAVTGCYFHTSALAGGFAQLQVAIAI